MILLRHFPMRIFKNRGRYSGPYIFGNRTAWLPRGGDPRAEIQKDGFLRHNLFKILAGYWPERIMGEATGVRLCRILLGRPTGQVSHRVLP